MNKWSKEWPTKAGDYWFFGWAFGSETTYREPELHFVKIRLGGDKHPIYVTNGHFLFKAEGAFGSWLPVSLPETPTKEDLLVP